MQDILDRSEITPENAIIFAQNHQRTKSVLNQVLAARLRGDYDYEQQAYAADSTSYPRFAAEITPQTSQPTPHTETKQLPSELINHYCQTQLADKAWEPHTLVDHRGRLENILDILHDKPASEVNREDMRKMREILHPRAKKQKNIEGKASRRFLRCPTKRCSPLPQSI